MCRDVTAQRALEEEARESEKTIARLETIRQVAVTLNHEINNALAAILGRLEIVGVLGTVLEPSIQDVFDVISAQAHRIEEFVARFSKMKEIKTVDYIEGQEKMIDVD